MGLQGRRALTPCRRGRRSLALAAPLHSDAAADWTQWSRHLWRRSSGRAGCAFYDVLQGSGWYPSVWYHTSEFTPVDGDYEVSFRRTWAERYCAFSASSWARA